VFPYPYIEQEAEAFFRRSFGEKSSSLGITFIRALQFPFNVIGYGYDTLYRFMTDPESKQQNYRNDIWSIE
jgi:hypothetical protein